MPAEAASSEVVTTTYATAQDYIDSLNTDAQWVNYDAASNTATITSFPATAVAGTFVPFQLAAGDTGVRAIASVTLGTSYGGGAIHLVAYRVLATIPVNLANSGLMADYASVGFPRLHNDTVPFLLWRPSATTAVTVQGEVLYAHG